MNIRNWIGIMAAATLVGCGGSGDGLDSNVQPVDSEDQTGQQPDVTAITLTQLQNEIFTPICAQCHIGASAPQGLRLDSEDNSYQHLVSVDSNEVPTLKLVVPGDPDSSYVVHKIEGRSSIVGSRMPLGQAALSSQQIADIRNWISNGALQSDSSASATRVVSVELNEDDASTPIQILFSRSIDADSFDTEDINLAFMQGNQTQVTHPDSMRIRGHQLDLWVSQPQTDSQLGKLNLGADGSALPQDNQGRLIDGDQDQQDGGAYEYRF